MKQIKLIIAAAAMLGLIASCEKDFTVQTGDTPVEFVYSSIDTTLNNTYIFIPVRAIAENELSTFTTVEYLGGTYTLKEDPSKTAELVDGSDIIFTSKELYVGAYDKDTDSTLGYSYNNIEIRVPKYLSYQSITFKLRLTGDYLGSVTEMTYTATAPGEIDITGTWVIEQQTFTITKDESENYYVNYFDGAENQFPATWNKDASTLTIDNTATIQVDAGGDYGVVDVFIGTYDGQYLNPDEASVWQFTSASTFTATNGIYVGFHVEGNSYAGWVSIAPGAEGQKQ